MASFIPINENNKFWHSIFRFLTGGKYDAIKVINCDKKIRRYYWNDIVINCINIFFFLLFMASAIAFFWIAFYGIYYNIIRGRDEHTNIIKGIELVFISPLALLITTAFHNYYKNVIIPIVENKKFATSGNDDSLKQNAHNLNKISSLVDMGIIKYLFVSIFISTIFVFMLGRILKISGEENSIKSLNFISVKAQKGTSDSTLVLNILSDSGSKNYAISEKQFSKLLEIGKEDISSSIKYDLFGLIVGVVCIVLLMIYLRIIGRNLNEDIENTIKFSSSSEQQDIAPLIKKALQAEENKALT